MKSSSAEGRKKVVKLQPAENVHFHLIGISSHENDYRLVWAINNHLKTSFVRMEDLVLHNAKTSTDLDFSRYCHADEDKYLTWFLISNRCDNGFLVPELRNFDFLIKINGEIRTSEITDLVRKLKGCGVISACFALDASKIKGIQGILQE